MSHGILKQRIVFFALWLATQTRDVKRALVTSKISLPVCFRNKRKNFTNKTKKLFLITRRRRRNLVWQEFTGEALSDSVSGQSKSWHVDSSTTNMAALSRGCRPILFRWNRCFLFSNAKSFVTYLADMFINKLTKLNEIPWIIVIYFSIYSFYCRHNTKKYR